MRFFRVCGCLCSYKPVPDGQVISKASLTVLSTPHMSQRWGRSCHEFIMKCNFPFNVLYGTYMSNPHTWNEGPQQLYRRETNKTDSARRVDTKVDNEKKRELEQVQNVHTFVTFNDFMEYIWIVDNVAYCDFLNTIFLSAFWTAVNILIQLLLSLVPVSDQFTWIGYSAIR